MSGGDIMFELLYVKDGKGYIFDSDDFSIEEHSIDNIVKFLSSGISIRGAWLNKDKFMYRDDIEKFLVFSDDKFAFFNCNVNNGYQSNISIVPLHSKYPSYSFGYNRWISRGKDLIKPEIKYIADNIYEISLFGTNVGFSVCVMDMGNKVIKPIYSDSKYVYKNTKLCIDGINIKRVE